MNESALFVSAKEGDAAALSKLVEDNCGLVKAMALRFRDRGVELEDLIQIGTIGLIKAVRGFDESYGTRFSTYAVPLITGEIKKFLRDDGMIKVSRETKRKSALLFREKQRIMTETGAEPRISELAMASGMTVEEAVRSLDATAAVSSLYDSAEGELSLEETLWGDNVAAFCESLALKQAVKRLPEEERKIILLRYYRNMSQAVTARLLGMTQVKVSRRERSIMEKLRKELS